MYSIQKSLYRNEKGSALIMAMIFVLIFSALAVSTATLSGNNVQIARNQSKANAALSAAHSGHEIIRFWISQVVIPGTISASLQFDEIASSFQGNLSFNGISNIAANYDGSIISIPNVTVNSDAGQSFYANITQLDSDTLQVEVTGTFDSISRTIRTNYNFGTRANNIFDYGVGSKGPLHLSGNIELTGINVSVEASVYIESEDSVLALSIIGNSQIAGDVGVVNPLGEVFLQGGQASIGGETGDDAIDNHVTIGIQPTEFPVPVPTYFEHYATNVIDSNTDTTADATFENVVILANTNPDFSGHTSLKGIVFIETPNIVTFTGGADITGIIVGDGDIEDNSGDNQINFIGNVESYNVSTLPDEPQFEDIKNETGTFVMAPGFDVSFGGSFDTLNGAIASNGIEFFGNAGGTINGSIINYSDEVMELSGNSDLFFNRSGTTEVPAGFVPEIVLQYDASSYTEITI